MEVKKENDSKIDPRGYLVCFGTLITFIAGIGHVNSFGLIYKDFIEETHSSAKSITTAHGVFAIMLAIGGLILNIMSKISLLRIGGLMGAFIFTIGSMLNVMISSTNHLPLTFGMLQGIGFGMMVPVCYSMLNFYFVKRRTQVMSIIKALQGFILIWYPQLLKLILLSYGFRGTLIIIAGIALHTFPGMMTMKTPKQIARKRDVKDIEMNHENTDLLRHLEKRFSADEDSDKHRISTKIVRTILEILNIKVLKNFTYCNICVGQSFVNFSDLTFFILQPMLLQQYGYEVNQIAMCISICAGSDVAGRFGLAVLSGIVDVNTRTLFYVATLLTFFGRLAILRVTEYIWVAVLTSVLGVLRAVLHVTSPIVISDHVSRDDFAGAYALFLLAAGLINVLFSPIIGLLKDEYEDYLPAFYALTACCVPCLILWPIEYIIKRKLL